MLAEFLFRPFEAFLNRGIGRSTSAQAVAAQLEGHTLALTVDATPFDLRLRVAGGRLVVSLPDGSAPDACIRGTPLALGRLLGRDPQAAMRDGAVKITGDVELASQFEELLRRAAPTSARNSRACSVNRPRRRSAPPRAVAGWGEAAGESVARGVGDYLQKDSRVVPTAEELREFTRRVDEFVNDVDRAEARIRRLKEGT